MTAVATAATLLGIAALAGAYALATAAPARAAAPAAPAAAQAEITTANVRVAETEAGNLLADAVRAAGGAEIGLVPASAFKPGAAVPRPAAGDQAAGLVDPASDTIVVLNLRGDQIMAALERSVSFAPQPSAGFLQVSGLRFTYDPKRAEGSRVSGVNVNGAPLEASRTYKVAATRPLANGQQGYFRVWDKEAVASDTGKSLAAALKDLAGSRGGSLSAGVDGRINQAGG